jgi:hypothetical protein
MTCQRRRQLPKTPADLPGD